MRKEFKYLLKLKAKNLQGIFLLLIQYSYKHKL